MAYHIGVIVAVRCDFDRIDIFHHFQHDMAESHVRICTLHQANVVLWHRQDAVLGDKFVIDSHRIGLVDVIFTQH